MTTTTTTEDAVKTEFEVKVFTITKMDKHPNADKLSLLDIDGCPVVVRSQDYKVGDKAVYISVDALVPTDNPKFEFLKKENKTHHRVRAMKLRGIFSMGLVIPWSDSEEALLRVYGGSIQDHLSITKYLPPSEQETLTGMSLGQVKKPKGVKGPKLPVYGLDPIRKLMNILVDGEDVVITEKTHGCNFRATFSEGRLWVGSHKVMRGCSRSRVGDFFNRTWLKLKSLMGIKHRANTLAKVGDIWWETAQKLDLRNKLEPYPDMVLYGEVYGEGVQDLTYDSPKGRKFRAFDVYDLKKGKFLDYEDFMDFICMIGLHPINDVVPFLYRGKWSKELFEEWKKHADTGMSRIGPHLTEGIVIKPSEERNDQRCGRVGLKYVGQGYLLRGDNDN